MEKETLITPNYLLSMFRGKPTVYKNGVPAPAYTYSYCGRMEWPGAEDIIRKFTEHGCRHFMLCLSGGVDDDWGTTPFWTDNNVFPDMRGTDIEVPGITDMARTVLQYAPDAYFWVRYNGAPPKRWKDKYPDHLLLNSYGKQYTEASLASELFHEQVQHFVANVVNFCEAQTWGDRVVGYLIYPLGEGMTPLTGEGFMFDRSPVMQAGFRQYLNEKYGSDAALQDAWQQSRLTLDTVEVPHDEEFRAMWKTDFSQLNTEGNRVHRIPHRLHWPDPIDLAPAQDYCHYMRELTWRSFTTLLAASKEAAPNKLAGIDAFKQSLLGWPLVARWVGDYQTHAGAMHGLSGAFGMTEMLDLPELDVICTPHDYLNRGMGFGYEGEGIGDAIVLHGKMMLMEEDQRTYSNSENETWNYLKDSKEVQAGFWRNLGSSISRGYNTYPMDVCNPSYFMTDEIQQVLGKRRIVQEASTYWEHEDVPSLVMVLDDAGIIEEDFTFHYQNMAVIQQRLYGMSRCGAPFRLHLFDDLARENFPACHKVFFFPNLFTVTPERLALLRKTVFRDGNVVIFGPASGISNGKELSAETASELAGIPLELIRKESPRVVTIDRFDHPITAGFTTRVDYGDSYAYGPLLVPQDHPEVKRLGGIQWPTAKDGAGLVIREFGRGAAGNGTPGPRGEGDYAVVFSCAMPLPAILLRELIRYSGTHIYCESDEVIFADSHTITLHAMRPGTHTIKLPTAATVWDLIEHTKLGDNLSEITVKVDPPQTNLFYLGQEDPLDITL